MSPFHCLIVSGSKERSRPLDQLLRGAGHVVVPANTPVEASEALVAPGLDFVVVDLSLPRLDLPRLQDAVNPGVPNPPDSLESAERRHIALTLEHTGGNRRQAARLLGIARSTMLAKLRKYGLESVRKAR
jgi:DNA-binding NtrC family response regulator